MSLAKQNIEELISLCRQKNQKAQFEIYNRYCKAMYNVAYRIVKDAHFAEDVMQEGFLKAFTKIDDYRQEVAFGAWLKRIIINYSIDFYKKQSHFKTDDFEKIMYKVEDDANHNEPGVDFNHLKVNQVLQTIESLKDNYRMVLTLHYIEGYDQEEITEILNISYANCRTTISRAKESLRKKLEETC
ncbi:RNA polymerase subunit sigma-24 [Flavobacterium noncentrifugens]|uniref:RNA polymerase sigma-70 factor, ECF subfamily n=1 Tax=Flavobacterium noncentrifugens TaxID=1128970 RepID=A0A1G9D8X6_9FLAO|nr:RNA polymerase sigma factor [Flavobacterium noncentrifugens]GEP52565.1 RNA polymerase subunit sigma-24 [Flavobacterium noncentrifugens]SDK60184.1 RNA polymerase sigma-70 factor, ECF subfamily [Flavobacterium noncentrifugens]